MHRSFTTPNRDRAVMYERSFGAHIFGHMHFDTGYPIRGDDEFEKLIGGAEENLIFRGRSVSPSAQSIYEGNSVDGLMQDTIWLVTRKNVTAVIMALDWNARIPLGVAFGVTETPELFEQHRAAFMHVLFEIHFSRCIRESAVVHEITCLYKSRIPGVISPISHFYVYSAAQKKTCYAILVVEEY
jgi:hypothetical protein